MPEFKMKGQDLYIDNKKVIKGYESYNGWYWFAVNVAKRQDTDLGNGRIAKNDIIYYGLFQGKKDNWGYFSKASIDDLVQKRKISEIPKKKLPYSGRRK